MTEPEQDRAARFRETERAVLGSILLDRDAIFSVKDIVAIRDFSDLQHQRIYAEMIRMTDARTPIDLVTLASATGEISYLTDLLSSPLVAVHAGHYAEIVRQQSRLRQLAEAGLAITRLAYNADLSGSDRAVSSARRMLDEIGEDSLDDAALYDLAVLDARDRIAAIWADPTKSDVVPTGLHDLDRVLTGGGFERGQLVVVAGRPGMAKSAFMLQIAHNIARRELHQFRDPRLTMIFSSEMTIAQFMRRAFSESTGLSGEEIVRGATAEHRAAVHEAAAQLARLPIWIDGRSRPTMESLRARVERLRMDRDVRVVMFDYLEQAGEDGSRAPSEELRISRAIAEMKSIAKDCNVTAIALSQINRGVEDRADKHPTLSDLRYSGRVEAEADIVFGLYRQDYYERFGKIETGDLDASKRGLCEIDVLKQRDGQTSRQFARFNERSMSFQNLD